MSIAGESVQEEEMGEDGTNSHVMLIEAHVVI